MDGYNSTLDQSLYEAVSSAKSYVSTSSASSGLSTNSQTALLHKKSNYGKRSKRRPHSAIVVSHLSHPDPTKLETLATFPPIQPNSSEQNSTTIPSEATNPSQPPSKVAPTENIGKTKCHLCAVYSLLIVFFIVLLALVLSIVLLVQLPSDSSILSSISSPNSNSSFETNNLNKVRMLKTIFQCLKCEILRNLHI